MDKQEFELRKAETLHALLVKNAACIYGGTEGSEHAKKMAKAVNEAFDELTVESTLDIVKNQINIEIKNNEATPEDAAFAARIAEMVARQDESRNHLSTIGIDAQKDDKFTFSVCSSAPASDEYVEQAAKQETSYQYPHARCFNHLAKMSKNIAEYIENHSGELPPYDQHSDMHMLSKAVDYLNDRGFIHLQSTKVVQGLSVSELVRAVNEPANPNPLY